MANALEAALVFDLGGELFALPAADVVKVVELGPLSRLPRLPRAVLGISHHRGRIVTVVDLGTLLRDRPCTDLAHARLILLERNARQVGLLTGSVDEMVNFAPGTGAAPLKDDGLITRIHIHHGRAVHMLSTDPLLSSIDRLCQSDAPVRHPVSQAAGL